ncbi:hypothetical protein N7532_002107 [Penicillium argentinense]|uniref:HTH CENPB-type domain-containing protein n=1 Tax=Penicillium argentinense TaxID=1131581 RepID=A0A9W9KN42_9EURO|nr:uncharacterized protein N7532_002107 [Penicillium argentinense]KAJ5111572.1 hypothetical protein N7532_002107 [Penicillium argentinense]
MPDSPKTKEDRILHACQAAKRVKKPNISALAREHGVSRSLLSARLHGRGTLTSRKPTNKALEETQEQAIIRWIDQLDEYGISPTPKMIEGCANQILCRNTPDDTRPRHVGNAWVYRFISRLPQKFKLIKQKPIEKKRLTSEDIGLQTAWFDRLEIVMRNIPSCNIYNFDETGFQLGQGKPQKVVTKYQQHAAKGNPSSGSRESVTAIECICADGSDVVPPYFIFSGRYHLQKWYESNVPGEWKINLSKTGYTNDDIAFKWLQHFDKHTKSRARGQQRLLLFDGHGSHLTYEFIAYCHDNKITPFCFLPKTTHFIQPLDGQAFQTYKFHYKTNNNRIAQWGGSTTDKADFLEQIPEARDKASQQRIIRESFTKRGIYPLRPQIILDQLNADREPTPDLQIFDGETPPPASSSNNSPPKTIRKLRRSISKAENFIQKSPGLNESFVKRLDRVFKSSLETFELATQLNADYHNRLIPATSKKNKSRKTVPKVFGEVNVKDTKRHIAIDKEREAKRAEDRARKQQIPLGAKTPRKSPEQPNMPTKESVRPQISYPGVVTLDEPVYFPI